MLFIGLAFLKSENYRVFLALALPFNLALIIIELLTLRVAKQRYFTLYNTFDILILSYCLIMILINFILEKN